MDQADLPILSLAQPAASLAPLLGDSFRRHGFALVADHGIDPDLIARGWRLARDFFALPEAEKRRYYRSELAGARGYTPFGVEIAKDAAIHDLKEFWHVGRDLPEDSLPDPAMPANIWPDGLGGFRETFIALYAAFDRTARAILSPVALDLGLPADWFDDAVARGNSVLRLLHYPPLSTNAPTGAIRAAAHEDINLITLLLGAEEAGLELLGRDGAWHAVAPPQDALVVNIGDMLQRLTNHVLPSTTHRVRNPGGERASFSRFAMPFFLHPRGDFPLAALDSCVTAGNPLREPETITADQYLQQRLVEIGLKQARS